METLEGFFDVLFHTIVNHTRDGHVTTTYSHTENQTKTQQRIPLDQRGTYLTRVIGTVSAEHGL